MESLIHQQHHTIKHILDRFKLRSAFIVNLKTILKRRISCFVIIDSPVAVDFVLYGRIYKIKKYGLKI